MGLGFRTQLVGAFLGLAGLVAACGDDDGGGGPDVTAGGAAEGSEDGQGGDGGNAPGVAGAPGGQGGDAPLEFLAALEQLGAKTDLTREPVDAKGEPLPTGYHPLKKPFATLRAHDEIYFGGPLFGGQREGILDDGFEGGFAQLLKPQFATWHDFKYRTAVAADVDGDGIQEFVGVYYDTNELALMAKIIWGPAAKNDARDEEPFVLADIQTPPTVSEDYFQYAVVASNVDDDPADELFVGLGGLYVFDDLAHDFGELLHDDLGIVEISICKGDFDAALADPHDETMVMWRTEPQLVQHYQVFDGLERSFEEAGRILKPTLTNPAKDQVAFRQGFCVAAETDGRDAAQEIAILSGDAANWQLMIMDDAGANYRTFDTFRNILHEGDNSVLAAADIDGDGIDEIAAEHYIFDGLENLKSSASRDEVTDIALELPTGVTKTNYGLGTSYQMRSGRVAPDYGYPQHENSEQFIAIDHGGALVYYARNPTKNNEFTWVELGRVESALKLGDVIAVGNVDFDSPVVRYTGEHELLYSNPELLVGMAAAPFYAGTNQEESSSTSFGRGSATSVDQESSVGFSVGFSIGYESEDPLGIASSSFSVSVSQEFDSFAQSGSTLSEFVTYTGGAEDSVVFTVVPFDVYYYEVISAPDASQIGNTLSVNLPRAPQTLLASSGYFDQFVDESRKSAPLFATHQVGDPLSYASISERDELCGGKCFMPKKALSIGQGSGSTTIEISKSESEGSGASYSLSTEIASEASLGGVSVGSSVGFSYGFSMTTTTEETTVFTGQLGSLEDLTPANAYSAGIFAHQHIHPTSSKPVLMVDYWVEQ